MTALFTIRLKLACAELLRESVTVTVKLVIESVTDGVPEIFPLEGLMVSPGGKGGEML